ncbi:3586_t:CDS:2 [Ambispora leptoticha]|uniref:3586_t:CDS:1 n=1 Tax=Ambispora leptoticha TaxID=144679 RepID=A0A9N9CN79_9GLOM|nr:3586_t:CDS:2 [Ambispora leptoticha]
MERPKKQPPHPFPRYGEIYSVYFNPKKGKEVGKLRPALVISNDIQNEYDSHIITARFYLTECEPLTENSGSEIIAEWLVKDNGTGE